MRAIRSHVLDEGYGAAGGEPSDYERALLTGVSARVCSQLVVVADSTRSGAVLATEFGRSGYSAYVARSAETALAVIAAEKPWLVALEPCAGVGLELLSRIASVSPGTKSVVVTMRGSIASAQEAILKGAVDYLTKPVTVQELLGRATEGDTLSKEREASMGVQAMRKRYIEEVLGECGSLARTAKTLKLDRRSLRRMMKRFSLHDKARA
jgi:two-component system response regulator RegA